MILPGVLTAVLFGWVTGHATMAIVSVAAMSLFEEGRLMLGDASGFLPCTPAGIG